jgi:hypothetical protein
MRRAIRGQAALESALTLPLVTFLFLGTLQMLLALQGRAMAEYAASRVVRVGSTNHADCSRMMDAAVLALIPSFSSFAKAGADPAANLAAAFLAHGRNNGYRYDDPYTKGGGKLRFVSEIVWLRRWFSKPITPGGELNFDQPGPPQRMRVQVVYWFPMKIPFANWVISKMVLGYVGMNPLAPGRNASWTAQPLNGLEGAVATRALAGETVLPIVTEATMRMMTPVRDGTPQCGGAGP